MDFDPVNYILCWTRNWQPCFLPQSENRLLVRQSPSRHQDRQTCYSPVYHAIGPHEEDRLYMAPTPTPLTTELIEEAPISLHGCANTALQPAPAFESRTTRGIRRPSGRHFASKTGPPGRRGPHQKHSGEWRSSNKFVGFGRSSVRG